MKVSPGRRQADHGPRQDLRPANHAALLLAALAFLLPPCLLPPNLVAQQAVPEAPTPAAASPAAATPDVSSPAAAAAPQQDTPPVVSQIYKELSGRWIGVLQYLNPAGEGVATMPAWLEIKPTSDGRSLNMRFSFDDGTPDVMRDTTRVTLIPATRMWTVKSVAEAEEVYQVEGYDKLKGGRGKLILLNTANEFGKKVETRTTVTLGRSLFVMEQQARLPGEKFSFRHAYTFTRAETPTDWVLPQAPSVSEK